MKILIIEDELLIQKSLIKLLQKKGAEVKAVSSGSEAIEIINSFTFDRIVCDLMLQDVTGFDIIESCKKLMSPEEIAQKFVIITAYSSQQVIQKANEYQCPVIKKPFENLDEALQMMMS